jgi:hypothetical protein
VKWTLKISTGKGYVASGMCRDTSGNVYCVSTTGYMIKISPDGIMQWRKRLLSDHAGPIIWLDLLSVKDGIVACGDTSLFKVDLPVTSCGDKIEDQLPCAPSVQT